MAERHVDSFEAAGSDGRWHTIHVFADELPASSASPVGGDVGGKSYRTAEGLEVLRQGGGEYQIVQTGVRLVSDDPHAL
jgi:hypothetical protein